MRLFALVLSVFSLSSYAQEASVKRFVIERTASVNMNAEVDDWSINV
ncbi:MAG: hypothetical protein ACI9EQ_001892, partial [Bacteroidia bacterium]